MRKGKLEIGNHENFGNWLGIVMALCVGVIVSIIIAVSQYIEWRDKNSFIKVKGIVSKAKQTNSSYIEISFQSKKDN